MYVKKKLQIWQPSLELKFMTLFLCARNKQRKKDNENWRYREKDRERHNEAIHRILYMHKNTRVSQLYWHSSRFFFCCHTLSMKSLLKWNNKDLVQLQKIYFSIKKIYALITKNYKFGLAYKESNLHYFV